jgi:hypothetical protein
LDDEADTPIAKPLKQPKKAKAEEDEAIRKAAAAKMKKK